MKLSSGPSLPIWLSSKRWTMPPSFFSKGPDTVLVGMQQTIFNQISLASWCRRGSWTFTKAPLCCVRGSSPRGGSKRRLVQKGQGLSMTFIPQPRSSTTSSATQSRKLGSRYPSCSWRNASMACYRYLHPVHIHKHTAHIVTFACWCFFFVLSQSGHTVFPQSIALAATWDTLLVHRYREKSSYTEPTVTRLTDDQLSPLSPPLSPNTHQRWPGNWSWNASLWNRYVSITSVGHCLGAQMVLYDLPCHFYQAQLMKYAASGVALRRPMERTHTLYRAWE